VLILSERIIVAEGPLMLKVTVTADENHVMIIEPWVGFF
jgi:hypothetical protein